MAAPKPISTVASIRNLPTPKSGQVDHSDKRTPGLFVRVTASGTKSFVVFYRMDGKPRRDTIGRFVEKAKEGQVGSLAWARDRADHIRNLVANKTDPRQQREVERRGAENRRADTYRVAVEDYIERRQIKERGNATANEVKRVLLREASAWHNKPVAEITPRDIRDLLDDVRDGANSSAPRPYLANRLFAYAGGFFAWCAEPGIDKVSHNPMAGLRRPWERETARERVFNDDEIKALWSAADAIGGYDGAFLKLDILTGKRKGTLAAMRWEEIDENGVWRPADAVPPMARRGKTRNKRVHVIPLSALAQRILSGLQRVDGNPHVFVGRHTGKHLKPGTTLQNKIKKKSGVEDFYWHALRHTAETRMSKLGVLPYMRDMMLDHAPSRGAGASYDHNEYIEPMTGEFEKWAAHVEGIIAPDRVRVLR